MIAYRTQRILAHTEWDVTAAAFKQKLQTGGKAVGAVLKRIKTLTSED